MLNDAQWERIEPLLPVQPGTPGGHGRDGRRSLSRFQAIP
jgi:transposase